MLLITSCLTSSHVYHEGEDGACPDNRLPIPKVSPSSPSEDDSGNYGIETVNILNTANIWFDWSDRKQEMEKFQEKTNTRLRDVSFLQQQRKSSFSLNTYIFLSFFSFPVHDCLHRIWNIRGCLRSVLPGRNVPVTGCHCDSGNNGVGGTEPGGEASSVSTE